MSVDACLISRTGAVVVPPGETRSSTRLVIAGVISSEIQLFVEICGVIDKIVPTVIVWNVSSVTVFWSGVLVPATTVGRNTTFLEKKGVSVPTLMIAV